MLKVIASTICGLLLCTLNACGGESPKPKPLGATSSPSRPSAQPTIPDAVKQKNKAGVKAAVEAFVAAWNHAAATGETEPLEAISTPDCDMCLAAKKTAEKTYSAGGYFKNADWTIRNYRFMGFESEVAYVEIQVDTGPNSFVASANASPKAYLGTENELHFVRLRWKPATGWVVVALDPKGTT